MYKPKEYNDYISMEQGLNLSVNIKEHTKTDYNKKYGDPDREVPDGTYEVVVDLSDCDIHKFTRGIIIKLPCGGTIDCFEDVHGNGGYFSFNASNGKAFYCEFN